MLFVNFLKNRKKCLRIVDHSKKQTQTYQSLWKLKIFKAIISRKHKIYTIIIVSHRKKKKCEFLFIFIAYKRRISDRPGRTKANFIK